MRFIHNYQILERSYAKKAELYLEKTADEKRRILDLFPELNRNATKENIDELLKIIDDIQQAVNDEKIGFEMSEQFMTRLHSNNALPENYRDNDILCSYLLEDLILAATHSASHITGLKNVPYSLFGVVNRTQTIKNIINKMEKNYHATPSSLYIGELKSGKKHGQGTLKFKDGRVYEATWENDQPIGFGTLVLLKPEECTYELTWSKDPKDPKKVKIVNSVKITWKDGRVYEGFIRADKLDGLGTMSWPDGCVYQGNWKADQQSGQGMMQWPDGRVYEGRWENGRQHGQGVMKYPDGSELKGRWGAGRLKKWEPSFCKSEIQEQDDQKIYIDSLKENPQAYKNKSVNIESILSEFERNIGFNPDHLFSLDQIPDLVTHLTSLSWFQDAHLSIQDGILYFISVVQKRCQDALSRADRAFMKEALVLFAQFIYFMNRDEIPEQNKKNALKDFMHTEKNPIIFACSPSIPQRIAGSLSLLKQNTIFLDPYATQKDLLLEEFVIEFMGMRANADLLEMPGYEIHFRAWLANLFAASLNFYTSFQSESDNYSFVDGVNNRNYLALPMQWNSTNIYKVSIPEQRITLNEICMRFVDKLEESYHIPCIEEEFACFVEILWPFKGQEKLSDSDMQYIKEQVFEVLSSNFPELKSEVLMDRYMIPVNDDYTEYKLNEKVFHDLPYLIARRLVYFGYYIASN